MRIITRKLAKVLKLKPQSIVDCCKNYKHKLSMSNVTNTMNIVVFIRVISINIIIIIISLNTTVNTTMNIVVFIRVISIIIIISSLIIIIIIIININYYCSCLLC